MKNRRNFTCVYAGRERERERERERDENGELLKRKEVDEENKRVERERDEWDLRY